MVLLFQFIVFYFSIMVHEVSHGLVAYRLGDDTAKEMGRLNLNPLKHIDPFGTFLLPLMMVLIGSPVIFGWAKPVPYNPYNLKNPKKGAAIIGAAGPLSNFIIALIFGAIIRLVGPFANTASASGVLFTFITFLNVVVIINLMLGVFNLVPIPPLDGSKLLFAALSKKYYGVQRFLERYAMPLLLLFIFFGLTFTVFPISHWLYKLIVGKWAVFQ
jgi:Zn-dependent protease